MIGIVSDHRGFKLKQEIVNKLNNIVKDYGPYNDLAVDYPDYAKILADRVIDKEIELGIAICGTGIGMSIACNKIKGIRCAKVHNIDEVIYSRLHNDANILAISENVDVETCIKWIDTFINTEFSSEERHHRRIQKIIDLEKNDE